MLGTEKWKRMIKLTNFKNKTKIQFLKKQVEKQIDFNKLEQQ